MILLNINFLSHRFGRLAFVLVIFLITSGSNWKSNVSETPGLLLKTHPTGTYNNYLNRLNVEFGYGNTRNQIEADIDSYIIDRLSEGAQGQRTGVITIPVVVHAIQHDSTGVGHVDYASIQNQIDLLNTYFRKQNSAEISSLPSGMQNLAADTRIEFVLAMRGKNCANVFAANEPGVTRTNTSQSPFIVNLAATSREGRYPMKFSSSFGRDGLSPDDYLNIWVCELGGDACGYASLPGDSDAEDGIVIDYRCFAGTQAESPFDQGKVLAQLTAQWLNVYNIWGIETNSCTDGDEVDDTPNQADANFGCPTQSTSCSNSGDFYNNFMDATDDNCRKFFTAGQALRMEATLFTYRSDLLNSQGAFPIPASTGPDIWMQDTPADVGNEPNQESNPFWLSEDIWVRNDQVPQGESNSIHQNPIAESTNYIYVRVRNRGCQGLQQGTLKLYWAKASSGLSYPTPWDGTITNPVLLGGQVGSVTVTVLSGTSVVYEIPWQNVPNPEDYAPYFGDKAHFCLLAVIERSGEPALPPSNEFNKLTWFVKNNNNVVWKNISIAEPMPEGSSLSAQMMVSNFETEDASTRIIFSASREEAAPFGNGSFIVDLGKLNPLWETGGRKGERIEPVGAGRFQLTAPGASFENIKLPPGSHFALDVEFKPNEKLLLQPRLFQIDISQHANGTDDPLGGQTFQFKTKAPPDSSKGARWENVNTNVKEDLITAHFPTDLVGYAGGKKGCIIKTEDGGLTWSPRRKGIPWYTTINSIHFVDAMKGFAVGTRGCSFYTTDGGNTWVNFKITKSHLRDVLFMDESKGFIIGDGAFFYTDDGGNRWQNVAERLPGGVSTLKNPKEILFAGRANGFILLSNQVLKTTDGGVTWKVIGVPGTTLIDLELLDYKRGYICAIGTGLLRSLSGGESWHKVRGLSSSSPQAVKFVDYKTGFVAGRSGEIFETNDYANNWNQSTFSTNQEIHVLVYLESSRTLLAFGKKGAAVRGQL